jgi:hypothetical protein
VPTFGERPRFGKPRNASPTNGMLGRALIMSVLIPRPSPPPNTAMSTASPMMSPSTSRLGKPRVLRTAISVRRSRMAMLIVFAVTSRIVNATATPIPFKSSARLPIMARKPARNAASVSVLVWRSLFSKVSSIARPTDAAAFGSSSFTTNVPAMLLWLVASYR